MTTNKDSKSTSEKKQSSHYYRCVHCHAPCPSLYRYLSASASSIKLTTCSECEQNVDPYVERELLLVAIDCILAREEAYRHVLYNFDWEWGWKPAIQFLVAWSILNTYIRWETLRDEDPTNEALQDTGYLISLAVFSFAGLVLQWLAIYFYLAQTNKPVHPMLASQVYLALVLPTSFDVVMLLVLIWENTKHCHETHHVTTVAKPHNTMTITAPHSKRITGDQTLQCRVGTINPASRLHQVSVDKRLAS